MKSKPGRFDGLDTLMKTLKSTQWIACLAPVALFVAVALPASAQTPTHPHDVNSRLKEQHQRIQQGVKSGQLTRREANRMRLRDARIRYHQSRDRVTGGHISRAEHQRLEHQLNRTSHAIHSQKHDAQQR